MVRMRIIDADERLILDCEAAPGAVNTFAEAPAVPFRVEFFELSPARDESTETGS